MKILSLILIALFFTIPSYSGFPVIQHVYAQDGDADGGGNPQPTKTFIMNKKKYSAQDMRNAAKSVYTDKDTVIITNTSGYKGTSNGMGNHFISLARYNPNRAAKLLNKWLRSRTFANKLALVRRTRTKLIITWRNAQKAKKQGFGSDAVVERAANAVRAIDTLEKKTFEEATKEAKARGVRPPAKLNRSKSDIPTLNNKVPFGDLFRSDARSR